MSRKRLIVGLFITLGCVISVVVFCIRRQDKPLSQTSSPSILITTETSDHGFVGWQVCAECHSQRVEEFQQTRHFQALRLPDKMRFPRGFDRGAEAFEPAGSPVRFQMTAQAGSAIVSASPVGTPLSNRSVSPIAFVYGAGAGTDEVYFTRRGEGLYELPVVWLDRKDCWGASLFNPNATGDLARPLTPQCLECHNVWVDYHRGSLNEYGPLQPHLLGVTCERCHGPANSHVDYHRAHSGDKLPAKIVQPKKLSRERQMDLCAQCHTNTVRYRRPPFSYRAGEALDDYFRVLEMLHPEDDRVANQTRYLKESRCYQQSDTLTCITCHDPHRKRPQSDPGASNQACFKCHQADQCGAQVRLPVAVRDNCTGCHMPLRNKIQVNFETRDEVAVFPAPRYEHRIAKYPEAEMEILYQWYATQTGEADRVEQGRLGRKLAEHWVNVAESASQEQRLLFAIDAYRQGLRFEQSAETQTRLNEVSNHYKQSNAIWYEGIRFKQIGQFDEAIAQFESLLAIQPKLAKAHYELGTLFAAKGRTAEAIKHLNASIEFDPNDPGPEAMLGWLDHLAGRPAEAYEHYRSAEQVEPWSETIENMLGQCLMKLGRWDEAAKAFERALEIDPHYREPCHALRQILRERFSPTDALPRARRAVELTQAKQSELLLALAEILHDLHQSHEAKQALSLARKTAERDDRSLLPQIQSFEKNLDRSRAVKGN